MPFGEYTEIGILLPNNKRQHRTLHIQKDVLPHALCSHDLASAKRRKRANNLSPDIGILLPNMQRQHRTLHIQKDVLPYALC